MLLEERERVASMVVFERKTCDREREGVVGDPAGAKSGRVAGGYAIIFLCYAIVFFLSVILLFLPKSSCMAAHTNETHAEAQNEPQAKTSKFCFL